MGDSPFLPWQQGAWNFLSDALLNDRLPNAFLLYGAEGIGKQQCAEQFAKLVLCHAPIVSDAPIVSGPANADPTNAKNDQPESQDVNDAGTYAIPCQQCKSCLLFAGETHPDYVVAQPEEDSTIIKIDQIRQLEPVIAQSAQVGARKVIIITPAEAMNTNASNAVLKSLEEPSEHTLFILVTHRTGQLLPTIRSRCQTVRFDQPDLATSKSWLLAQCQSAQLNIDDATLDLLMAHGRGAPLQVYQWLTDDSALKLPDIIEGLAKLLKGQTSAVELAQNWKSHPLLDLLKWQLVWIQQVIRYQLTTNEAALTVTAKLEMWKYLAQRSSGIRLFEMQDEILQGITAVNRKTNPNELLLLETLLLSWQSLMRRQRA
ncbi:DNA polymerase III, delta'' subunit [Oleiphilus messinensis]|uniref:DNA polymerase III subunit delta' n=1 Tax=Oleiphilus messinensis TaxID=141451 RepID=A0A1Y0ID71_9GAMM|nr:DNA polymerase III subunit delta' C-terminal domain-containing protein [Oleiphilus messinensis]ARU57334.1 DNA polymerase III, delta'' subunit [Oleiphilus messinensis]